MATDTLLIGVKRFSVMNSERNKMYHELQLTERDLTGVQFFLLLLLSSLFCYAIYLVYIRDWKTLVGLLPATTAACAALLVAKTATRLLIYNMFVRVDDHAHDIVRITHHTMAIVNDLRGRIRFMKIALSKGNRPLIALTKNAETIEKRYEALYDRDLYRYLPGNVIDTIVSLSGSVFGLSSLIEGVTSVLDDKGQAIIPSGNVDLIQAISKLESELDVLFTIVENLRTTLE